ncbi:hypothetical protein GYMLUDRAFT_946087 [Collybiopsis luxurians FD-317 M1]|uniref:Concanavalin A-like lectin/glucanase n=1 Tax=Collybiopsis luxurians FD-317 M1 TaxID=944289 RepID=A0A0D0ARL0_9AGAR|nr:hypothetical protein GYMLUDRAFT_946087 [Collybiopsis luxurians FD-317 M1]
MELLILFLASSLLCDAYARPPSLSEPFTARNVAGRSGSAIVSDVPVVSEGGNITHAVVTTNWAGVVIETLPAGQNFQTVYAQFTVPTQSQTAKGAAGSASIWVGIDGATTGATILQTGVDISVSASGVASYSAWYEWFPNPSVVFDGMVVNAGDVVIASVVMINSTTGVAGVTNESRGNVSSIELSAPNAQDFAADGILVPFSNFTPVTFITGAFTNTGALVDPSATGTIFTIQQNGTVLTSVSVATPDTITVKHT